MNPKRIRSYALLTLTAAIWGMAAPIIKFTLDGIDPIPFLAYRFLISSIPALLYFLWKGFPVKLFKNNFRTIISYSLLAFPISLSILFLGLDKTTVLDSALINISAPLLMTIGGAILFHDRITKREWVGSAVAISGSLLAALSPIFTGESALHFSGNILILVFVLVDTASVLLTKHSTRKHIPPLFLVNFGMLVAAITIIPLALATYTPGVLIDTITSLELPYHFGVWFMALISGSIAYLFWVEGQKSIEISEAAIFSYLRFVFMVPLAVLWLGESVTMIFVAGLAMIAIGVVVAESKASRSAR